MQLSQNNVNVILALLRRSISITEDNGKNGASTDFNCFKILAPTFS